MKIYFKNLNVKSRILFILMILCAFLLFPKVLFCILHILNIYSDAVLAIVAMLGLLFGQSWLNTSKKKMKGQLDFDIARKYLKAVLQLRDSVKIVRNPFISVGEMQSSLEKSGFNVEEYNDNEKSKRSVYSIRWNKIQEAWTDLEEVLLDAEVSWGSEVISIQKELDQLIKKLRSVVWLYLNYPESFNNKGEKNDKVLYGTHDEDDEFAIKINNEVEKIRTFLKKHL